MKQKRKIKKLGICPHCKQLVSRRFKHTLWRGKIPQFVYVISKDKYYHKHCWEEVEKSMAKRKRFKIKPLPISVDSDLY
ncbi:MAG: hypothetical protein KAR87_03685 [Candidatus Aenigmarchaeota archaeon]|nr:hypothetical protein [Candidatus Aenigmarchaeota archaeon]